MKKYLIFLLITLVVVIIFIAQSHSRNIKKAEKETIFDVKIIIYQNGKDNVISKELSCFEDLQREVENFLISSDNALLELVTKEVISKIKDGKAIEIMYSKPKDFKINNPADSRKFLKIDRILIPFEGYYSPNTVFFGHKFYSSGPFINSSGSDKIKRIKEIITY